MAVWGTLLWSVMDQSCYLTYNADFWTLLLLFKIYVVLAYMGIVVSFCLSVLEIGKTFNGSGQGSESSPILPKKEAHNV
jgi:hypothetical protein